MPPPCRRRVLVWTAAAPCARALRRQGYHVLPWTRLERAVRRALPRGRGRTSLRNPAAGLLAVYARRDMVAVTGVPCRGVADLRLLLGYVVEPAFRAGCTLLVAAPWAPADLDPAAFVDPEWRCPWTLERLRHLAARYADAAVVPGPAPAPWWRRLADRLSRRGDTGPRPVPRLDPQQNAAVAAGDGVVQVIAPAGSGKTTVLVERVQELTRRGTSPGRILCTTFNRDACLEMAARLARTGLDGVAVRSFHGLGLDILKAEGRLRDGIEPVPPAVWAEVAARAAAAEPGCGLFPAAAAAEAVADFKLARMIGPEAAWREAAGAGARARAAARAYALCEEHLRRTGRVDFDDLIFGSVTLLQQDARIRARWQARFARVLVDEYQDIEPAQALLVGLLAAPEDSLFCVGDEDQCIYAWRRAEVERVIALDQVYPGLERHPLVRNYRCGRDITGASRRLIARNRRRFRKPLLPGVADRGRITVWPQRDLGQGAAFVARLLQDAPPGRTAVLARTGGLLEAVAAACGEALTAGGVELATVHGAKGREWDRVILYGADQGRFPLGRAVRAGAGAAPGGGLEDERRLFYVALTRARRELDIVCSARSPSRFLLEAGLRVGR